MFRRVELPEGIAGKLLLHSMPGRREPLEQVWEQVGKDAVGLIVCLTGRDEVRTKSPSYAKALEEGTAPCKVLSFEVPDFGVPSDRDAFWSLAGDLAKRLREGDAVLIHCGAGIGRTGTLAAAVLLALGEPASRAQTAVSRARSGAETAPQRELIAWCASQVGART